ncbi:helix-turn-helix domain-containing protein [Microbacterium sp. NPDC055502]
MATSDEQKEQQRAIGARLRSLRDRLGITQEDAAQAVAVPRTAITALEKGERAVTATELATFAQLYRSSATWILGQEDNAPAVGEALFRATKDLSAADQDQVLRFAEFLAQAGAPSIPPPRRKS